MENNFQTLISNILIIGSGGAGLRAAIESKLNGLSVNILGKRERKDVHTSLAAGGINASFGNVDKGDNWQQHFVDTYLEGYEIADPKIIELMAKEATFATEEIDKWGANFDKLENGKLDQRFFGAHKYRRTCYSGDFTGRSILKALLNKTNSLEIPILDDKYVTEILISEKKCFGAFSFDINTGEKFVHLADSVILATGGHTRIWKRSSSRINENNGDGIHLALKAGCELVDMEMVQFHPTGMVLPEQLAGTLVTEAVRGEGGRLINNLGERFMVKYDQERMELSTRDKVALANYKEIVEGRATKNGGVFLDISHKDKNFILSKLPRIYRQFIESQMLDITKSPMEVAPTAHYSMGGVVVNPEDHFTGIQGLYACGEVAGGLHGANRLGGNSLAEILIFGKRAGNAASNYSRNLKNHIRSMEAINKAEENFDAKIKNGNEISKKLEFELRDIMWEYCGVIRDENKIKLGLEKIDEIKKRSKNIDIQLDIEGSTEDLISAHNIESSIVCANVTLLSALERRESRGSHQRADFPNINESEKYNIKVRLDSKNIFTIKRSSCEEINNDLKDLINSTKEIKNFKGKLIE